MPGARADLDGVLEDVAERYPGFERELYETWRRQPPHWRR
jgi:hypothetical protein